MIPLILLHIALHAQAKPPVWDIAHQPKCHTRPAGDGVNGCTWCDDNPQLSWCTLIGTVGQASPFEYFTPVPDKQPESAEHVIEIRTKRDRNTLMAPWKVRNGQFVCPHGFELDPLSFDSEFPLCISVTKTLWIDGQRMGVIKEVEEK